jgi:hypothetical protein
MEMGTSSNDFKGWRAGTPASMTNASFWTRLA